MLRFNWKVNRNKLKLASSLLDHFKAIITFHIERDKMMIFRKDKQITCIKTTQSVYFINKMTFVFFMLGWMGTEALQAEHKNLNCFDLSRFFFPSALETIPIEKAKQLGLAPVIETMDKITNFNFTKISKLADTYSTGNKRTLHLANAKEIQSDYFHRTKFFKSFYSQLEKYQIENTPTHIFVDINHLTMSELEILKKFIQKNQTSHLYFHFNYTKKRVDDVEDFLGQNYQEFSKAWNQAENKKVFLLDYFKSLEESDRELFKLALLIDDTSNNQNKVLMILDILKNEELHSYRNKRWEGSRYQAVFEKLLQLWIDDKSLFEHKRTLTPEDYEDLESLRHELQKEKNQESLVYYYRDRYPQINDFISLYFKSEYTFAKRNELVQTAKEFLYFLRSNGGLAPRSSGEKSMDEKYFHKRLQNLSDNALFLKLLSESKDPFYQGQSALDIFKASFLRDQNMSTEEKLAVKRKRKIYALYLQKELLNRDEYKSDPYAIWLLNYYK